MEQSQLFRILIQHSKLSEKDALSYALKHIGAKKYLWEDKRFDQLTKDKKKLTVKPKGELVIIDRDFFNNNFEPILAYKFDIYATSPFSSATYFIDASNGSLVFKNDKAPHFNYNSTSTDKLNKEIINYESSLKKKTKTNILNSGTAATRYAGSQTIETELFNGSYRLRDYSRGNGIETYNAVSVIDTSANFAVNAVDFTDNDNNWTAIEFDNTNKDNAALDAHWAAMMTYDYFYQKHNRNSIDGNGQKIKNYVHVNMNSVYNYPNNDNALWDHFIEVMVYGDGASKFDPLTCLDIVAHEIGHGLADKAIGNGGLLSSHDPGAIDEGLSDIWGAMVEYFAAPNKQTYLSGEDVYLNGPFYRSLINPNSSVSPQPDTYQGANWVYSGFGRHTNMSILSHWFYLLAEGGAGTNDNGDSYSLNGIGKEKAAKIVYRALTTYLVPNTTYPLIRTFMLDAAEDLYGANSFETALTCQAWYAVGVGNTCSVTYNLSGYTNICSADTSTYTLNYIPPNTTPIWTVSSNLQIISSTNSTITVKAINSSINGNSTITANVNGDITQMDVWIGKPKIDLLYNPISNYVYIDIIGDNNTDINNQGLTNTTWQKISDNGACGCVISGYSNPILKGLAQGNCNDWSMYVKITSTNSCGSSSIYRTIAPPDSDPCESTFTIIYDSIIIEDPCEDSFTTTNNQLIADIFVYNLNGTLINKSLYKENDLSKIPHDIYIIKVKLKSGKTLTKKVLL